MVSDPLPWPAATAMVAFALATGVAAPLAPLAAQASGGWTNYTAATERRIAGELRDGSRFLGIDFTPQATYDRAELIAGRAVVRQLAMRDDRGAPLDVASATVQHWRGAVLVPDVQIDDVLRDLRSGPPTDQEDVLRGEVLSRSADAMQVFLRIQRTRMITVVYDTEHRVTFQRHGPGRASSTSIATKIAEVSGVGTGHERELAPGDDRGLLWRLNAYWRYEQVESGVIAECESVTLSRDVPFVVRPVAMPLVRSAARESMERTVLGLRSHFMARRMPRGSSPAR